LAESLGRGHDSLIDNATPKDSQMMTANEAAYAPSKMAAMLKDMERRTGFDWFRTGSNFLVFLGYTSRFDREQFLTHFPY
jgi:hypothetical protein